MKEKNLWEVGWSTKDAWVNNDLLVVAPTASIAIYKAIKKLRRDGKVRIKINSVKSAGNIDIF